MNLRIGRDNKSRSGHETIFHFSFGGITFLHKSHRTGTGIGRHGNNQIIRGLGARDMDSLELGPGTGNFLTFIFTLPLNMIPAQQVRHIFVFLFLKTTDRD